MQKINFQDLPSTATPLSANNLNQLQTNVENAINGLFEMGSWTPVMNNANVTYEVQVGRYYKINNLVYVFFKLQGTINSVDSPAYAFISGLPYTTTTYDQAGSLYEYANCFYDNLTPRLLRITQNQIGIQNGDGGGTGISSWETGHGTFYLSGSATYVL